jgi:arylsulfatase A-like enzyme
LYQASVRNYYRLISEVDREVGKLRLTLRELGLEENTVIVFSSDNGFYLGEHGLAGKWLMHEESIRAPLLVFDPRLPSATRGKRIEEMSLNLDIAPTLLDAAGLEIPAAMPGRSVYDLIHRRGAPWRRDWYYEHHDVSGGWIPRSEGVRTERWKYTKYIDNPDGFEELYDLGKDPGETRNLAHARQQADVLEVLRRRYTEWKAAQKDWRADRRWTDPPFPPGLR